MCLYLYQTMTMLSPFHHSEPAKLSLSSRMRRTYLWRCEAYNLCRLHVEPAQTWALRLFTPATPGVSNPDNLSPDITTASLGGLQTAYTFTITGFNFQRSHAARLQPSHQAFFCAHNTPGLRTIAINGVVNGHDVP